ncbi:hypothetical protein Nepgr_003081 [Nepenthes gracilis]|uniref:Uncharacterized protein n=1 Tax=Nepenthes gracilis TaxID=150966 RepID=A0AAD3XCX4_NEPGR|nr:hypothetical protein Nepgr_003081 [Nepenthes gracilis]
MAHDAVPHWNNSKTNTTSMKKKKKKQEEQLRDHGHEREVEILKAVAQAWLSRSSGGSSNPTASEFDTHRRNFQSKPSRFKLEAMEKAAAMAAAAGRIVKWDFAQSLLDSYEIVAVSKRLERGLALDYGFSGLFDDDDDDDDHARKRVVRRKRESKNSLRNLFNKMSSKRFNHTNIHRDENAQV